MVLEKFTEMMTMAEAAQVNAKARKVIEKYFGQGCFTCPGMKMESISLGALIHNIDPEVVVRELNELESC